MASTRFIEGGAVGKPSILQLCSLPCPWPPRPPLLPVPTIRWSVVPGPLGCWLTVWASVGRWFAPILIWFLMVLSAFRQGGGDQIMRQCYATIGANFLGLSTLVCARVGPQPGRGCRLCICSDSPLPIKASFGKRRIWVAGMWRSATGCGEWPGAGLRQASIMPTLTNRLTSCASV